MESERRGLLVLFEGFPPTVIRSQVVTLAGWLARRGIVRLDLLSVACSPSVMEQARRALPEITERLREEDPEAKVALHQGLRPVLPGATALNRRIVHHHLATRPDRYRLVHARTDYAAHVVAPLAKHRRLRLLWDCRGDAVAEFIARTARDDARPGLPVRWRARRLEAQSRSAASGCHAAIFVTRSLHQRFRSRVSGPCHVIPTVADPGRFFVSEDLRARTRAALGYNASQPVFVFSGTLAAYQGFAAAADWFSALVARQPDARLLVLTPAVHEAARVLSNLAPACWSARQVDFDDMNAMLNAADFSFLLRPRSTVNEAAFPTKFAEYGLAGLQVVMSDATPDCLLHAGRAGNLVRPDVAEPLPVTDATRRDAVSDYYRRELTQSRFGDEYRELYGS